MLHRTATAVATLDMDNRSNAATGTSNRGAVAVLPIMGNFLETKCKRGSWHCSIDL